MAEDRTQDERRVAGDRQQPRKPWEGLKGAEATKAKEDFVVTLRQSAWSYVRIAKEVGYADGTGARKAFERGIARHILEPVDEVRLIDLYRLDEYQRALWVAALRGNVQAINCSLAIMDRRAKMLGLDAPTRLEVMTVDEIDAEVRRLTEAIEAEEARLSET